VVLERFDGRLSLRFKGRELGYREVLEPPRRAPKLVAVKATRKPAKQDPPPSHPWRDFAFGNGHPWSHRTFSLCL
jgi:hypothetical protein